MQVKRQSNGQVITLGSVIASGGEGEIREFPPDSSLVAKVYHANKLKDIDSDKLRVMLTNPPDDSVKKNHGCVSIAWPVDLLLSINGNQQIIGFLMPRVPKQQVRPIHDYYSPKTRREKNLGFNYLSLHRTARNFAGAMSALHAKQYVIGDVNESNILVYDTAMVTLVDTDSFQVPDFQQGKVYRCPVGKPEYTPPELQRKTFADYDRTPEHDLFGLGALIFQLLMEGMHPFAAVYQGTGESPLTEKRILTGHFPHGTKTVPYRPAPNAVPFDVLHPTLRQLFIRCFEDGHNNPQARPDARTWVKALDEAEKDLVSCGVNSEHRYGGHLRDCPWCERKKRLGLDAFPAMSGGQSNIPVQIPLPPASKPKAVSSPAPSPTPSPTAIPYQPTPTPAPTTKYNPSPSTSPTPTPIPKYPVPPQLVIVAGGIAIATIWAMNSQWQAYQTLNTAQKLRDERNYEACISQVSNINQNLPLIPNLSQFSQSLLKECKSGFNSYKLILEDAKSIAINKQYEEAIQKASQIPNNSSIYQESVKLIDGWSKNILEIATDKYQQGNLVEAIEIVKGIPIVPQNEVIRQNAQKNIEQWQTNWKKAENEFQKAEESLKNGKWQSVIDSYGSVSSIPYWKNKLEPLVEVARPQREAELKIEKHKDIELAILKGEMMVRDTSRVWEKFWEWGYEDLQYVSTPAAWMYLTSWKGEKLWCWLIYSKIGRDRDQSLYYKKLCDGSFNHDSQMTRLFFGNYNQSKQPIYNYSGEKSISCIITSPDQTDKKINACSKPRFFSLFIEPGLPIP
ncbi:MAG: helix-hairpin-helix domain-containing protein [Microcoleus sp.]